MEAKQFKEFIKEPAKEWVLYEWSFNGHSKSFSGRMYYQKGTGFMFIEKEDGSLFTPSSSCKLFYR